MKGAVSLWLDGRDGSIGNGSSRRWFVQALGDADLIVRVIRIVFVGHHDISIGVGVENLHRCGLNIHPRRLGARQMDGLRTVLFRLHSHFDILRLVSLTLLWRGCLCLVRCTLLDFDHMHSVLFRLNSMAFSPLCTIHLSRT